MYSDIREEACEANRMLPKTGLVEMTFGNVGVFDKSKGVFAIKPSGVDYAELTPETMVIVDLEGKVVDGKLRPSSDTPTYVELFKNFNVRAVAHTHSIFATAFAQALKPIPALGTTHADYFYGEVPVTRALTDAEIKGDYELETGKVIVETFKALNLSPDKMHAVLVRSHAPFIWADSGVDVLHYALALEVCAKMASISLGVNPELCPMQKTLMDKHYLRKHGANAYYGQPKA